MKILFLDAFPIPAFLAMRPTGLAISENAVHAVQFKRSSIGLELQKFGARELPRGAIKEGYVNDKSAVTEILRSLQKELSMEFVSASLPEEKAYFFKTQFPKAGVTDFRQAVELRIEENVPISAANAVFDYVVIPESAETSFVEVVVSVLPRKVVETYLEIIKTAGLKAVSFGIEAAAAARAVVPKGHSGTFLVVNLKENSAGLSIISRGVLQFNLTIQVGGDQLATAFAEFSPAEGAVQPGKLPQSLTKNQTSAVADISDTNAFSVIKNEIRKLFVYWQTRQDQFGSTAGKIDKIILCGRGASLAGFDERLSMALRTPVEVGNVWRNGFSFNDFIPDISFRDSLDYAAAVGLALPQD